MAENVDPFIYPLPRKIQDDPELRGFFEYFVKWAHQIWKRTGGGDDLISDTGTRESYPWILDDQKIDEPRSLYPSFGSDNQKKDSLDSIYPQQTFDVKEITAKTISNQIYTAVDNMFIKSKLGSTIKMPATPSFDCVIYAHNGDGTLMTIDGNGKKINGKDKIAISQKGNGVQVYYFIEDDEYIAI